MALICHIATQPNTHSTFVSMISQTTHSTLMTAQATDEPPSNPRHARAKALSADSSNSTCEALSMQATPVLCSLQLLWLVAEPTGQQHAMLTIHAVGHKRVLELCSAAEPHHHTPQGLLRRHCSRGIHCLGSLPVFQPLLLFGTPQMPRPMRMIYGQVPCNGPSQLTKHM